MELIRVTEAAGLVGMDWSLIPERQLNIATERGSITHRTCALIASGMTWYPDPPESCVGFIESFQHWFEKNVEEVVAVEIRLTDHIFGYTGEPDLVARIKGHEGLSVIDYKTPTALQKSWRLQMAAYFQLCQKAYLDVQRAGSLRLDINGKAPRLKWYDNVLQDYQVFLSAVTVARFKKSAR